MRGIKEYWQAGLFFLVAVGVFVFALERVTSSYFLFDDNANYFLPAYVYNWRAVVEQHNLPEINFHQYLATPHLAAGQTGVFFVPAYIASGLALLFWGDIGRTIQLLVWGHLSLAAWGMYWLLRQKKVERVSAFLAGLIYVSFAYVVGVGRAWVIVTYLVAYLPWGLGAFERWLSTDRAKWKWTWFGCKLYLVSCGYIQWTVMVSLFEVMMVGWRVWAVKSGEWKRIGLEYVGANLGLVLVSAPLLWPLLTVSRHSVWREGQLPWGWFVSHSVEPLVWLRAQVWDFENSRPNFGGSQILYVGIPYVILMIVTLIMARQKKMRQLRKWLVWGVVAWVFTTQVYGIFYWVPIINWFRWPFKYYPFFLFYSLVAIVGMGSGWVVKKWKRGWWLVLGVVLVGNVWMAVRYGQAERAFTPIRIDLPVERKLATLIDPARGRLVSIKILGGKELDLSRLMSGNSATMYGYYDFGGYDQVLMRKLNELTLGINNQASIEAGVSHDLIDYLRSWGVEYVVSRESEENEAMFSKYEELEYLGREEGVLVYRIRGNMGVVEGNGKRLETKIGVNKVRVNLAGFEGGWVAYKFPALPGFHVVVDGKETAWRETAQGWIEVVVEGGVKEAVLVYRDADLRKGLWVLGMTAVGIWIVRRRR